MLPREVGLVSSRSPGAGLGRFLGRNLDASLASSSSPSRSSSSSSSRAGPGRPAHPDDGNTAHSSSSEFPRAPLFQLPDDDGNGNDAREGVSPEMRARSPLYRKRHVRARAHIHHAPGRTDPDVGSKNSESNRRNMISLSVWVAHRQTGRRTNEESVLRD